MLPWMCSVRFFKWVLLHRNPDTTERLMRAIAQFVRQKFTEQAGAHVNKQQESGQSALVFPESGSTNNIGGSIE